MPTETSSNFLASNQNRNKTVLLGGFFNPAKRSTYPIPLEDISLMFDFLITRCPGNSILTWDCNMPETSWETYQSSNDYEETIMNFAIDYNLKQHVKFRPVWILSLRRTTHSTTALELKHWTNSPTTAQLKFNCP